MRYHLWLTLPLTKQSLWACVTPRCNGRSRPVPYCAMRFGRLLQGVFPKTASPPFHHTGGSLCRPRFRYLSFSSQWYKFSTFLCFCQLLQPGNAGFTGSFGHCGGHCRNHSGIEGLGNDVVLAEFLVGNDRCQRMRRSHLHFLVDVGGAHIQCAAEMPGKARTLLI